MELVIPSEQYLAGYSDAAKRGWSPNTMRPEAAREDLELINADPERFVALRSNVVVDTSPIVLADGSTAPRLPGVIRWIWDGEFCGLINLRYAPGTNELPPHVPGHAGYSIVPWKSGRGYATLALKLFLPEASAVGLDYIDLITDHDNIASQRVIGHNGGVLVERFTSDAHGTGEQFRYRITL